MRDSSKVKRRRARQKKSERRGKGGDLITGKDIFGPPESRNEERMKRQANKTEDGAFVVVVVY